MSKKFDRRALLRLVGASSAIGLSGTAVAESSSDEIDVLDDKHNLPHDIAISNFSSEKQEVLVEILGKNGDSVLFSRQMNLPSPPSASNGEDFWSMKTPVVDADTGLHRLRVTANDRTAETKVLLEGGKIPSFVVATVLIKPDGGLIATSAMA